jgi:hypothetical protein
MDFKTYMGRTKAALSGEYGLEIETEALDPYEPPSMKHWTTHADGSLRNFGIEYVLRQPLNYEDIPAALNEFHIMTTKSEIRFLESVYSSVHIHVNVYHMEMIEMVNFITLYILFENILNRYCGPDRDGNLFCLKTHCAESTVSTVVDMFKEMGKGMANGRDSIARLNENNLKYAALNLFTLRKFGSLEIRTHRGSTDVNEIFTWVEIVNTIKKASKLFVSPQQILLMAKQEGYEAFFNRVFDSEKLQSLLWNSNSLQDIDNNIWYILLIAKSANWDVWPNLKDGNKDQLMKTKRMEMLESTEEVVPVPTRRWQIDTAALEASYRQLAEHQRHVETERLLAQNEGEIAQVQYRSRPVPLSEYVNRDSLFPPTPRR